MLLLYDVGIKSYNRERMYLMGENTVLAVQKFKGVIQ